ncbi:hypothetical protein BLX88_04110 [Bacillus obstructivus]|nr:hypothetical protein BLX88_04110 [Bacillus obstructivus]
MSYQPKSYNKFLAGAATAAVVASAVVPVATHAAEKNLTDVKEGSYYAEAVNALAEAGVIKGYEDGTFRPNNQVTRAEVAKIIAVQLGLDTENAGSANYSDAKGHWANTGGYLAAVAKAGIMKGDGNGTFRPNAPLTRAEMASIVVRAYDLQAKEGFESQFKDLNAGGAWAADAIKTLEANGYANGIAKGQFGSASNVKRADVAVFLFRVAKGEAAPTVESVSAVNNIEVNEGAETVNLPKEVEVKLSNGEKAQKAVEWDKKGLDLNKPGEYTLTGDVADTDLTASVKVVVKAVDPKVESVSAINATEVLIKTNKALSKESAENVSNYSVFLNGSATTDVVKSAVLQEDGKSVLVRFTTPAVANQTIKVATKSTLLTSKYERVPAFTSDVKLFSDNTAPTLKNVEYNGTDVVATFSEPISSVANVRVDGTTAAISSTQATADDVAGNYSYVITGASKTAGTHNVVVSQVKDANGNETGTQSASYTIVENAAAPKVSKVEALSSTSFKVSFDKAIVGTTAKNAVSNLTVKKGSSTLATSRVTGVLASDNKSIVYTVSTSSSDEVKLYNDGETSATLNISFDGYKDANGLLGTAYTGSVTLSKDATAPSLLSKNLVTVDSTNTIVTLTFDEAVDAVTAKNDLIVIKKDNIVQSASAIAKPVVADVTADTTERTVTLTFDKALTDGQYELVLPTGLVKDKEGNDSVQDSVSFTVSSAASYFVPTVSAATTGTKNVLTLTSENDLTDSALLASNYTLDDAALPTGTDISFVDNKKKVQITLPDSFKVSAGANYKLGVSANVKDVTGASAAANNTTGGVFYQQVALLDNVAPTLTDAKIVESTTGQFKTLKLTFSEELGSLGSTDLLKDFNVTVNGSTVAVNSVAADSSDTTGKTLTVVIGDGSTTYSSTQTTVVTVAPISTDNTVVDVTDVQGNALTTGTSKTATK